MAPTWRRLFDTWEKAVAPGLEEITASTEFREGMASVTKWNAAGRRRMEQASRQVMHAWNIPTATDVRKLRRQISDLEDEISALRRATQKAGGQAPTNRRAKLAAIDAAIAAAANGNVIGNANGNGNRSSAKSASTKTTSAKTTSAKTAKTAKARTRSTKPKKSTVTQGNDDA